MTPFERFTSLLEEMNVRYIVEPVLYDCELIGHVVFVSARAEGFVNYSDGDGTAVQFDETGNCISWA